MANTNVTNGVLVDGQLTIETKDVSDATPFPMGLFTFTAFEYSLDKFRPGFFVSCYKDKGLSSERKLIINFPTGQAPVITQYSEAFTTETNPRPYDFEFINCTSNIVTKEIAPHKNRYNVIEFNILAKRRDNNETRELAGSGYISITNLVTSL
ncbi:hypothetical protein [Pseudomonas sp. NPDC099000]|uniref:hypothetical protein n=1 Tax=Pseudomonas sp. NPDC099000 TaxID=3364488 RepID=UPI00383BC6EB